MKYSTHTSAALIALLALSGAGIARAQSTTDETVVIPQGAVITDESRVMYYGHNGLTLNGAVGNPLNPTADIPSQGAFRIQGDYFDFGSLKADHVFGGGDFGDANFYGVHIAGRPFNAPLEISGGIEKLRAGGNNVEGLDDSGFAVGAKYQFYRSASGATIASVGAGYSRALFDNMHAYVVGTRAMAVGGHLVLAHLGGRFDRFKIEGENAGNSDFGFSDASRKFSIFAGAEVPIDRRGRLSAVGEIGTKNGSDFNFGNLGVFGSGDATLRPKFPYSLSLRYADNGLAASVGVMRQGIANKSGLFAQVGKTF